MSICKLSIFTICATAFSAVTVPDSCSEPSSSSYPDDFVSLLQRSAHITKTRAAISHNSSTRVGIAHSSLSSVRAYALASVRRDQSCVYYASSGSPEYAPFVYYNTKGGAKSPFFEAVPSPSGLCYFPEASCSVGRCCGLSERTNDAANSASNWSTYLCLVVMVLAIVYGSRADAARIEQLRLEAEASGQALGAANPQVNRNMPTPPSTSQKVFNTFAISVGITASVYVGIVIAESTQLTLSVLERNSMLATDAWLTPIGSVFQFLEDTMTVKISFAMATGQLKRVKALLFVGVIGGIATGVAAALLLTGISYIQPLIELLLVPYKTTGTGCSLIPTAAEIVRASRGYWLLISWSMPFNFISLVFTGFILGSTEFGIYGLAMGLSQGVLAAIWFGFKPADGLSPGLNLLGWANFWSSFTYVAVCVLGLLIKPDLREKYKLQFYGEEEDEKGGKEAEQEPLSELIVSCGKEAAEQGGEAMALDVCVQFQYAIGVFMSGILGMDVLYQISAMQAAMPMFGTAYATGLGYMIKLRGSVLVGLKQFQAFSDHLYRNTWICVYFAVVTIATTLPFRKTLAFYFASPACVYASEESCLPTYSGIFGGGVFAGYNGDSTNLQEGFMMFSFAAAAMCLFTGLKAGLYCCFEFPFMARCGLCCLLLFIPCVCVAFFVFGNSLAMYAAMYVPTLVIGIAFAVRLLYNREKMLNGESGPWEETIRKRSMSS